MGVLFIHTTRDRSPSLIALGVTKFETWIFELELSKGPVTDSTTSLVQDTGFREKVLLKQGRDPVTYKTRVERF